MLYLKQWNNINIERCGKHIFIYRYRIEKCVYIETLKKFIYEMKKKENKITQYVFIYAHLPFYHIFCMKFIGDYWI